MNAWIRSTREEERELQYDYLPKHSKETIWILIVKLKLTPLSRFLCDTVEFVVSPDEFLAWISSPFDIPEDSSRDVISDITNLSMRASAFSWTW